MPDVGVLPVVGAGAAAGSAAGPAGAGAGAGAGVDQGAGAGAADAGAGDGADATPKSVKINFGEEGEGQGIDFSFEDEPAAGGAEPEFKFEQLDAIKDSNPDLHKSLKAELSKGARFGKHGEKIGVKTPEDFKGHVERIDKLVKNVGRRDGKVGLDAIESTIVELSQVIDKVSDGDPEIVGKWFKENPAGMQKLTEQAIENWQKTDAQGFSAHVSKNALAALTLKDGYGQSAVDALNALYTATIFHGSEIPAS